MRYRVGFAFCLLAAVFAAGVGCQKKSETIGDSLSALETKARALNLPMKPSEVAAQAKVLPENNAALDVKEVLLSVMGPLLPDSPTPFSPGLRADLRTLASEIVKLMSEAHKTGDMALEKKARAKIAAFRPILDRLSAATKKPEWDFERDWDKGITLLMPDLATLKTLSQMLATQAYFKALEGDTEGAINDLRACRRLGTFLRMEPMLIPSIVGVAVESIATASTIKIARAKAADKQLIQRLISVWEPPAPPSDYRRIWQMEFTAMVTSLGQLTPRPEEDAPGSSSPSIPIEFSRQARSQLMEVYIESNENWPDFSDFSKAEATVVEYAKRYEVILCSLEPEFAATFDPNKTMFGGYLGSVRNREATYRLLRVFLGIVQSGPSGGKYTLPALAQEKEWLDPFSDKPFLLKNIYGGFVLYSVGENRKDDGGISDRGQEKRVDIAIGFPTRVKGGM